MNLAVYLMIALIVLASALQVQAQMQDTIIIEVGGYIWNKTTLNVLIVTSENESWWSPSYVNATLRAIDEWNNAITIFTNNYSQYNYLAAVNLQVQVSNQTLQDFDIIVNYTQRVDISGQDAIGVTTTLPYDNGTIQQCIISLGTQSQYLTFTEKDIQSVATHEFGHTIGIGHSNSSTDLMYPEFDIYASQLEISTLNIYGVATAFEWIINPNLPVPTTKQELYLPTDIPYKYISTAAPAPQSISDNPILRGLEVLGNILLTPYILLIIVVGVSVMIVIEVAFRLKRRPKDRKNT